MPESSETDIPIQQTEGASVVDLPEATGDVTESAAADATEWSSDAAFLKDSGGLEEWRSFTATRTASLDATQVQLPKLTLLDDSRGSSKALDSRAIAADPAVVDKTKLAAGTVPEFEGGQSVPGEPPRITDPLPSIPPGIHIIIPNPHIPGFSVVDPALPGKPGITADPSIPIKAGVPGDAAVPVMPSEPGAPKPEFKRGQSVPTEPPKITDPLPRIPPPIQRVVDSGEFTGRKSDAPGASLRHPNSRDTTPAGQAVAAFKATLRAAEAQNQDLQNPKLAAQLAAQLELKKLAALNPEKNMKETAAAAAVALLARKALMRGEQGNEKNSAVKPGARAKELGKRDPSQTPDAFAAKPALAHEKADLASLLNTGLAASIRPEKGKLAIASSFPVDPTLLHNTRGKELIAGIKLHGDKAASDRSFAVEPNAARLTQLNESTVAKSGKAISQAFDFTAPTLSEKGKALVAAHTPVERALLRQSAAQEFVAAHTPIERSLLRQNTAQEFVAAHTPIERSLLRQNTATEFFAVHTPVERSRLRHGGAELVGSLTPVERSHSRHAAAVELVASQTPVERTHSRHAAAAEVGASQTPVERSHKKHAATVELAAMQTPVGCSLLKLAAGAEPFASNTPVYRSLLRQVAGTEVAASNAHIARSLVGPAAGREFVAAAIPQDIKSTSKARHALEPSIAIARLGEPTAAVTFKSSARPLNFSPISDGGSKLLPSNGEHPQSQEQLTVLHPIKRLTPNTYARTLSENHSAPDSVEKLHGRRLEPSTEKAALKVAKLTAPANSASPQIDADETIPVADGEDTIKITSAKTSKPIEHGQKVFSIADGDETTTPLTMLKSLLTSAKISKNAAAPARETVREAGSPAQKDVREHQVAKTVSEDDNAERLPAKFAGELKLRVTYLHIGNRIFLLDRRLVDKGSHDKAPTAPTSELIVSVGAAAVIAGRRLRRRKKKGAVQENSTAYFYENQEEPESVPTTDSSQFNRESVSLAQAVTRFSYMIQPGDTLTDLAQAIWQDSDVAWLLAEVNKLTQEWQGSECSITLVERQIIELPLPEEVVNFYRSGLSTVHKKHRLTTLVTLCSFNEELTTSPPSIGSKIESGMVQDAPVVNIQNGALVNASTF